ncbi:MAG TPA: sigma-70 family RNA polymerase sigma factor [Acidimicrobiales bacterium]|nr:sigma-70 family RNA polymerase sigma factor [Acidimicrobiales bacterium]
MQGATVDTDQKAREEQLVREHLNLVDSAVHHLAGRLPRHIARDELLSAAMAGLAQAARAFDPGRHTNFSHYASARIRGALLDELRNRDWATRSVRSKARRMQSATEELTAGLGRAPTTAELAENMGVTVQAVGALSNDVHRSVVLNYDSVVAEGGGEWLLPADEQSPDVVLLEREQEAYLFDAVAALPDRLRHVVLGSFFEERSVQQLAVELGVSPSRISQMRAEAMILLKDGITSQMEPEQAPVSTGSRRVARRTSAYRAAVAGGSDFKSRITASSRPLAYQVPADLDVARSA